MDTASHRVDSNASRLLAQTVSNRYFYITVVNRNGCSLPHYHMNDQFLIDSCFSEAEDRRVVLFYIMNDVVQRAKKKHSDVVCSTFEQPVILAVSLGRFESSYLNRVSDNQKF